MAMRLGAKTDLLDEAWWLPSPRTGRVGQSTLDQARQRPRTIYVDAAGQRFVNESNSYMEVGKAMYARDKTSRAVPCWRVFMVTGHAAAMEVYGDPATFPVNAAPSGTYSSCNAVSGPFVKFSAPVEGDDITDVIMKCRHELPFSDQLPSFDPPNHTAHRHLLMRLITPKRLKENERFMWQFADGLIDRFVGEGSCELVGDYAEPFTLTVIAELERVPESDHSLFRERLSTAHPGDGAQAARVPL
jgi:cytochrome P450 family 150 subfamily A5